MSREIINGVPNQFGRHEVDKKLPYYMPNEGILKTLIVPFFYDDLPVVSANDAGVQLIPANSFIHSAYINVSGTAFAGGTSYNFGLYESDGTVIDADGIDAAVATATLAANAWVACDGALIGASIGTAAGQVVIAATGTFTAGYGKLAINYISNDLPRVDA